MAKPQVGLGFDLASWKRDMGNAAKAVKKGLGEAALHPFNRALKRSIRTTKSTLTKIKDNFLNLKTFIAGLALTAAVKVTINGINKVIDELSKLENSSSKVETAMQSAYGGIDQDLLNFINALGQEFGILNEELYKGAQEAIRKGFSPDQVKDILTLGAFVAVDRDEDFAEGIVRDLTEALDGIGADPLENFGAKINENLTSKVEQGIDAFNQIRRQYQRINQETGELEFIDPSTIVTAREEIDKLLETLKSNILKSIAPELEALTEKMIQYIKYITQDTSKFEDMLKGLIPVAESVMLAIAAIGTALVESWVIWEEFKEMVKANAALIKSILIDLPKNIIDAFAGEGFTDAFLGNIKERIKSIFDFVLNLIKGTIKFLLDGANKVLKFLKDSLDRLLSDEVLSAIKFLSGGKIDLRGLADLEFDTSGIEEKFDKAFGDTLDAFDRSMNAAKDFFKTKGESDVKLYSGLYGALTGESIFDGLPDIQKQPQSSLPNVRDASELVNQRALDMEREAQKKKEEEERKKKNEESNNNESQDDQREMLETLKGIRSNTENTNTKNTLVLCTHGPQYYRTFRPARSRR